MGGAEVQRMPALTATPSTLCATVWKSQTAASNQINEATPFYHFNPFVINKVLFGKQP